MLQFSKFVWAQSYAVSDVFNNFLLIDATDRSKISKNQKRFFITFFANTPCKNARNKLKTIDLMRINTHIVYQAQRIIKAWEWGLSKNRR